MKKSDTHFRNCISTCSMPGDFLAPSSQGAHRASLRINENNENLFSVIWFPFWTQLAMKGRWGYVSGWEVFHFEPRRGCFIGFMSVPAHGSKSTLLKAHILFIMDCSGLTYSRFLHKILGDVSSFFSGTSSRCLEGVFFNIIVVGIKEYWGRWTWPHKTI